MGDWQRMALPHMAILKEKLGTGTGVDTSAATAYIVCFCSDIGAHGSPMRQLGAIWISTGKPQADAWGCIANKSSGHGTSVDAARMSACAT